MARLRMDTKLPFLSPPWIERARPLLEGTRASGGGVHRVVFEHHDEDAGTVVHSQVWQEGHVSLWCPGRVDRPDAVIRLELWAAYTWLFGGVPAGSSFDVVDSAGIAWTLPPTAGQLARTASSRRIDGASLAVEVDAMHHPLGDGVRSYRFVDGILREGAAPDAPDALGTADPLSLSLGVPFRGASSFLLGGLPFRDVAAESWVDGDVYLLGTVAGLLAPADVLRRHADLHRLVSHAEAVIANLHEVRGTLAALDPLTAVP